MTDTTTNDDRDFGFGGEEFLGQLNAVPYAQFLNAGDRQYGLAVTSKNAELAGLELIDSWKSLEHEFSDGTDDILFVTTQPKILVLNRSQPMMSNETETIAYNKAQCEPGGYKAFSYAIVWFLDENNKPISELPFRLKCSGYSGLTFLQNYNYYNNPNSFCQQFLEVYKSLTKDSAIAKNDVFYAHAVYQPQLVRKKATSRVSGQSSWAVMTDGFIQPNQDNFGSMIIQNGSVTSIKIKEAIETTKPWLKTETVTDNDEAQIPQPEVVAETEIVF